MSVFKIINFFLGYLRFFGFFPMELMGVPASWNFVINPRYYVNSVMNVILQVLILGLLNVRGHFSVTSLIIKKVLYWANFCQLFNQINSIIISVTTSKFVIRNIYRLAAFDRDITNLGADPDFNEQEFKELLRFAFVTRFLYVTVSVTSGALFFLNPEDKLFLVTVFCSICFSGFNSTLMTIFIVSQRAVMTRYQQLNKCFKQHFEEYNREYFCARVKLAENPFEKLEIIKKLSEMHLDLIEVSDSFCRIQSFQLATSASGFVAFLVLTAKAAFQNFFMAPSVSNRELQDNLLSFLWVFFYLLLFFFTCQVGSRTTLKGLKTARLIFRTLQYCQNPDILDALALWLRQIRHKPPQVRTSFFDVDWTFFGMIVGATISFFFASVQFEINLPM